MDVFDALADPLRRDLLRQLRSGAARVVDLAAAHPVSRPAISRHLRVLHDADLVAVADIGRERHYTLRSESLREVQSLLDQLATRPSPVSGRHLDALDTEVRRATRDRDRSATSRSRASNTDQEDIA